LKLRTFQIIEANNNVRNGRAGKQYPACAVGGFAPGTFGVIYVYSAGITICLVCFYGHVL